MPSTSEVGHAKNVANFSDLIAYCTAYGATYNPSQAPLQLASLNTLHTSAQNQISNVTTAKNAFDTATGNRQVTFQPLRSLATRIFNFVAVTDANPQTIADAKAINNKLQGKRATNATPPNAGGTEISVSRQSYDMLTENFAALIDMVNSIPSYTPNETELTIPSLTAFHANLQTENNNVLHAEVAYSNARIARDTVLYDEATGLVNTASDVKKYVKAIYGATSPQYKQISGIKFTKSNS